MRTRIAAVIGIVVFLVLSGTGISFAYWSTAASTTGTVVAATVTSATNCSSIVKLTNAGFESPDIGTTPWVALPPGAAPTGVPGWGVQNDTTIEIWRSQLGSTPPEGAQIAELNGTAFSTLYQDVATTPGQTLRWSIMHRGREGTDAMRVSINAAGGALVQQDQWSTNQTAFVRHEGAYVVPAGQTSTRISLIPVSTANNNVSIGNLIDDVTFGTGPCIQSPTTATTITNITRGGTTYYPGDVVEYTTTVQNVGGNHAIGTVYSTTLPSTLVYQANSLQVAGVARTDGSGDDVAEYVGGIVTARLGSGATASAGGMLSPTTSMTVRYRATVQAAASGGNLVHTSSIAYADPLAPSWPLTAAPATLTTPVTPWADLATTVVSAPALGSAIRGTLATWQFRITNNGPSSAAGVTAVVNPFTGTFTAAGATVAYNVSGTWVACPVAAPRTCSLGALASGATADIRIQGTIPAAQAAGTTYTMTATAATTTADLAAGNNAATSTGTLDLTAPTAPTNLASGTTTTNATTLTWTASTDAIGVTGYRIFRNGTEIGTSATASYTDSALSPGQPYWYWVVAVDAGNNASTASTGLGVVAVFDASAYRISWPSAGGTRCLGASGTGDPANLQSQTCLLTAFNSQRFTFTSAGGGLYRISPVDGPTRGWHLENNNSTNNNDVELDSGNTTVSRARWTPVAVWDGVSTAYLQFQNNVTAVKCVEVTGQSATSGTQVQINDCTNIAGRRFTAAVVP